EQTAIEGAAAERSRLVMRGVVEFLKPAILSMNHSFDTIVRIQPVLAQCRRTRGADDVPFDHLETRIKDGEEHGKPAVELFENVDHLTATCVELQPQKESIQPAAGSDRQSDLTFVFRSDSPGKIKVFERRHVGDQIRVAGVLDTQPQIEAAANLF